MTDFDRLSRVLDELESIGIDFDGLRANALAAARRIKIRAYLDAYPHVKWHYDSTGMIVFDNDDDHVHFLLSSK